MGSCFAKNGNASRAPVYHAGAKETSAQGSSPPTSPQAKASAATCGASAAVPMSGGASPSHSAAKKEEKVPVTADAQASACEVKLQPKEAQKEAQAASRAATEQQQPKQAGKGPIRGHTQPTQTSRGGHPQKTNRNTRPPDRPPEPGTETLPNVVPTPTQTQGQPSLSSPNVSGTVPKVDGGFRQAPRARQQQQQRQQPRPEAKPQEPQQPLIRNLTPAEILRGEGIPSHPWPLAVDEDGDEADEFLICDLTKNDFIFQDADSE